MGVHLAQSRLLGGGTGDDLPALWPMELRSLGCWPPDLHLQARPPESVSVVADHSESEEI